MHQRLYSHNTPHTSPLRASYGMSFVSFWVKIDRVIMALHCILFHRYWCRSPNSLLPNTWWSWPTRYIALRPQKRASLWSSNLVSDMPLGFNTLWPNDAIWRQRSGSILAQVMTCYLMAPSHYLNQCWLIGASVSCCWPVNVGYSIMCLGRVNTLPRA